MARVRRAVTSTTVLAIAALLALAPNGAAHLNSTEHGALTFHDEADAGSSNDLACTFFIMGHNMSHATGDLMAAHDLDQPSAEQVELGNYTGVPNEEGTFDFFGGPFELPESDEWQVWATMGNESEHATLFYEIEYEACEEEEEEEEEVEEQAPPETCTGSLSAKAEDDATVELEWERNELADHYLVHMKRSDEANFTVIGNTTEDGFDTEPLEVGATYTFQVTAHAGNGTQIDACGMVEVTAIPYFGAAGALFATIGAIGAYAVVRRRR